MSEEEEFSQTGQNLRKKIVETNILKQAISARDKRISELQAQLKMLLKKDASRLQNCQ